MFAAHIRPEDNTEQSVSEHNKAAAILAQQYGTSCGLPQMSYLSGFWHDVGKGTETFNQYIHGTSNLHRGEYDHAFAGAKYLSEHFSSAPAAKRKTANLIARTIVSHHGLHDWCTPEPKNVSAERIAKTAYYEEIQAFIQKYGMADTELEKRMDAAAAEYQEIAVKIREISGSSREQKAFYFGLLERLLQSMLMDADRTDTAGFMSGKTIEQQYDTKILWETMQKRLDVKLASFSSRTDAISVQRRSISERCLAFASHPVGICQLIVPTGGGKTLSAMRFAIEYCKQYGKEHIFYIAPFMSILEQNSDEIRSLAGEGFLEHHSDAVQKMHESPNANECETYEYHTELWDSPVIATTLVQFLNTLFSDKTASVRRMHRLANAVIIIDEVQSIPISCVSLFNLAMNFLAKICHSTIVLCSATQPPFDETKEYAVMLDENSSMTGDTVEDFVVFARTELIPKLRVQQYTYEEAAAFTAECFQTQKSILFVTNTKKAALEIYRNLQEQFRDSENAPRLIHLSTSMCPQHRRTQIAEMRKMLEEKQPLICVTTQLIEAGVDISFGCVIRSLAGMDNAAQAAGRCNRHGEFGTLCPVYLLELLDEKLGSLTEIQNAQDVSRQILSNIPSEEAFLPQTMRRFFEQLYRKAEHNKLLHYPVKEENTTLVDLLSVNAKSKSKFSPEEQKALFLCGQRFATAGRAFHVIAENTRDVLVPYDTEAEALLAKLEVSCTPWETMQLLRKAQKYCVGLYPNTWQSLNDSGALLPLPCGAMMLRKEYYHDDYGVTTEPSAMPNLCF